ncbi:DUF937 domain-containing protein [Sphingomonas edaphi]|uniref:DUF937 domain-containing protein n=1 Tax=Sphingomonas edaphi TaxID=2315689 RepID=A0A418PYD0_9SPHN|nr:DUF937 domain-containing protein [Sphingomonas edaphi]RIX27094.1 DUF937 domain-containing protein [Sphingomonas edaphi]
MNIEQMLQQTNAIEAVSRELGVDPATAQAGATALLPSILSGFQNPVGAPEAQAAGAFPGLGGLGGLLGSIGGLGGGNLLDNVTSSEPTEVEKGNQILGQVFGSKDGSRAVAASAAAQSGVEPSLLKKMLPILAMIAAGYVMKQAGQGQGGLGGALGGILGGQPASDSGLASAPRSPAGSGSILDDLIGAAGKYLGR